MQLDKRLHFVAGLVIALAVGLLAAPVLGSLAGLAGLIAATAAGRAKEAYDARNPAHHTSDGWDAVATLEGGLAGEFLRVVCLMIWPIPLMTL